MINMGFIGGIKTCVLLNRSRTSFRSIMCIHSDLLCQLSCQLSSLSHFSWNHKSASVQLGFTGWKRNRTFYWLSCLLVSLCSLRFGPLLPFWLFIFTPFLPPSSLPDSAAVCEARAEGFAVCETDSVGAMGGADTPPQRAATPLCIRRGAAPPGGERSLRSQSASHHSEMCGWDWKAGTQGKTLTIYVFVLLKLHLRLTSDEFSGLENCGMSYFYACL